MPNEQAGLTNFLIENLVKGYFISLCKVLLHHTPDTGREEWHIFNNTAYIVSNHPQDERDTGVLTQRYQLYKRPFLPRLHEMQTSLKAGNFTDLATIPSCDTGPTLTRRNSAAENNFRALKTHPQYICSPKYSQMCLHAAHTCTHPTCTQHTPYMHTPHMHVPLLPQILLINKWVSF